MSLQRLAALLITALAMIVVSPAHAQRAASADIIKLWPAMAPGSGKPTGPEKIGREGTATGAYSNISEPRMEIVRPAKPNGSAVLVIGGGGYFRIQIGGAAKPAAERLAAQGVTVFILYYRLPGDGWNADAPSQDGQRAMRIIRANASRWSIDPQRVGVVGFSAGGHLAGILATRGEHNFYTPIDAIDRQPATPTFAGLIYPVISLKPPFNTTQTSKKLSPLPNAVRDFSVEDQVSATTPPIFLAHASDDPIANVGHSIALFQAMQQHKRPVEMHIFETGGHSWGIGKPGTSVAQWPDLFLTWSRLHGWIG